MPRRARGFSALVASVTAILVIGVQAVSANVLWTMTASPATAVVGEQTTFAFTATNLDPLLGIKCVVVEIPASIAPGEGWIVGSSTTAAWTASRSGQLLTAVIDTGDGNEKLVVGDWVSFAVAGVPTEGGTYAFHAIAYSGHECVNGARVLAAPPVVVTSGIVSEPTPAPTPEPSPTPTPELLEPILPLPPILQPRILTTPAPAATPTPSPSPSAATNPGPSPAGARSAQPPNAPPQVLALGAEQRAPATLRAPADAGDASPLAVALAETSAEAAGGLSLGPLGVMDGLSVWAIPSAVVGGPGLLVILWVAVQAAVAAAWIPAVRVMRGADGRQARPPYGAH